MELKTKDVRAEMPNYEAYKNWQRDGQILGIAVHHSATIDRTTGAPIGNAESYFTYHVKTLGWMHGGYNYVIPANGEIEYALDEKIAAYHAGFRDPSDALGLEQGQYWNNHYLAICLAGWFSTNRTYRDSAGQTHPIPNNHTLPNDKQLEALLALIHHLRQKYDIPVENVRVHRELAGNGTVCPGLNFNPATLRERVREYQTAPPPPPLDPQPEVGPGEHVLLLPDADKYLAAALYYIYTFRPDASFSVEEAAGRWEYVTAIGGKNEISDDQLLRLRRSGAALVQRIAGEPQVVQATLDGLAQAGTRFLHDNGAAQPPAGEWRAYTVQPGDSLSRIAGQMYGSSTLWQIIFEANRDILSDPGRIVPGQRLKIPPKPE
jgi:hypothetical protein